MGVRGESADIVRQAQCGVDIEPDNDAELVEAVCRLCDDKPFYESLCLNGRRFVSEHYTRDAFAARYITLIAQVARGEKAAA
jgi:glycosyltransferase involved in cell wall biosynthesis